MDYIFWIFWLELVIFVFLMGLSAFFSSSETALFSLNSMQIEQMRQDNHPRVGLIERLLSQPRRLIVTILIGNELANVAASVLSAAVIIDVLGAENKWINLFIMVPILLVFGEITPKTLAIRNNVAFAGFESRLIEGFARLIKPVRLLVRFIADRIITLIVGKERSPGNIITEDMLRTLAREAVGEGALDHTEAQFIDQIFDFGNKTLQAVMTPRSNIFFLPVELPLKDVVAELHRTRRTKVPVFKEFRDNVVGIVHARDLLGIDTTEVDYGLEKMLWEPYFVPESKPAANLFHDFRERKQSIALTVDEYGGVTGLVTMEDLLECIFGEIHSPSDKTHSAQIQALDEGGYLINGATPLADVNEALGSHIIDERSETIGGVLLHAYGALPPEETVIILEALRFTIVDIESNRIEAVRVETHQPSEDTSED